MIEQVRSITDEFAVRAEREATAKRVSGVCVQRLRVEIDARGMPPDLVRRELVAPAGGVPEAGVIGTRGGGTVDEGEALGVCASARDEERGEMLQRLGIGGIEIERATCEVDALREFARVVKADRLREEQPRLVGGRVQCGPSTSCSASRSSNTRNEFVRTLPWLLTASATRVMVSSSGASAMTT